MIQANPDDGSCQRKSITFAELQLSTNSSVVNPGLPAETRLGHAHYEALGQFVEVARIVDEHDTPLPLTRTHQFRHTVATNFEVGGIASGASFGKIREHSVTWDLGVQAVAVHCRQIPRRQDADLEVHAGDCTWCHDEVASWVAAGDGLTHQKQRRGALTRRDATSVRSPA